MPASQVHELTCFRSLVHLWDLFSPGLQIGFLLFEVDEGGNTLYHERFSRELDYPSLGLREE